MASPSSTVLGTYELLEHILINLPVNTLFVVQRVATLWTDLIERSEPIKTKMFRIAEGPLLHPVDTASTQMHYSGTMRLHPAVQVTCLAHSSEKRSKGVQAGTARLSRSDLGENEFSVDIALDLTAVTPTLGSMLLTQPPIVAISHMLVCCYGTQGPSTILRLQTGITFGDLIAIARRVMNEHIKTCETCRCDEWEAHHQWKFFVSVGPKTTREKSASCYIRNFREASQGL